MLLGLGISGSALTAENTRLNVIASNLANMDTTATPGGGPYRSQFVVLQAMPGANGVGQGVEVAGIYPSQSPFKVRYDPQSPLANAQGDVLYPNVNMATQMVDLIAASRAYSANANAFSATKSLDVKALTL